MLEAINTPPSTPKLPPPPLPRTHARAVSSLRLAAGRTQGHDAVVAAVVVVRLAPDRGRAGPGGRRDGGEAARGRAEGGGEGAAVAMGWDAGRRAGHRMNGFVARA